MTALARDAADDLYVGYLGGTIPRTPQLGTFVFGPKAHGMPAPLQAIPSAGVVQGLAFDEAGMLYVSERATPGIFTQGQSVRVFSDPATKPTFVREIAGTSFAAPLTTSGISIAAGELYVANLQTAFPAGGSDSVSAYRTSASGRVRPDRTIVPQGGDEAFAALGVVASDGLLFITFTGQTLRAPSGVYVFDATQSGVIKPKDMLFAPDGTTVEALAVGP